MSPLDLRLGRLLCGPAVGIVQHPGDVGQVVGNAPIDAQTEVQQVGIADDTGGQTDSALEPGQKIYVKERYHWKRDGQKIISPIILRSNVTS